MANKLSNQFKIMGVMNITPNSFSDGGALSITKNAINTFKSFVNDFDIIDVGAESTAPFNTAIGAKEELERLEEFFYPLLSNYGDPNTTISIDTYKPEVFFEVADWINSQWPATNLIFNDVSGKVDDDLISILEENTNFKYVLSHNLSPYRGNTSDHMNFVLEQNGHEFINELGTFFMESLIKLESHIDRVIIDPCFGFSKTREQNHYLLSHMEEFLEFIPNTLEVLVGISRKSFLRFPSNMDAKIPSNQRLLDSMQTAIASGLLKQCGGRDLIFRTHESYPFKALVDSDCILKL